MILQDELEGTIAAIKTGSGNPEDFLGLHGKVELIRAHQAKLKGDALPLISLATTGPQGALGEAMAPRETPPAKGPSFAALVEQYSQEQRVKGQWTPKSDAENTAIFAVLEGLLPRGPVEAMERADFVKVATDLTRYPSNATKRFPGKTPKSILGQGDSFLSENTINKYLVRLSSICKWAEQNGMIPRNLAEGLQRQTRSAMSDERDAFTNEEVKALLDLINKRATSYGRSPVHAFHYWMPLLGFYTGARVNELASLRPSDVVMEGGHWCIHIHQQNDGTKATKTDAGVRFIPLHPELIRLGFIEFRDERQGERLLFDGLSLTANGYGGMVSRWFNGHPKETGMIARAGINRDRLSFHSLRHTFMTNMERAEVAPLTIKRLAGHRPDDVTFGRYSKGIDQENAFRAISKLPSISHLLVKFSSWSKKSYAVIA